MRRTNRRKFEFVVLALATSATSCATPTSPVAPATPPPKVKVEPVGPGQVTSSWVEAHNVRRAKAGLSPLTLNPMLEASAVGHARDMASRRKMSHKGGDGSNPFERIERTGYQFGAAAENVAFGFDDVESVMVGWMKSPGHRRNILGKFSEIGVGRAIASDGASYWCVTFGTPLRR